MKKMFVILTLALCFFYPKASFAAVSLPWSSTLDRPTDWTQGDSTSIVNGLEQYGNWTSKAGSKSQANSLANFPGGGGVRGWRYWIGDSSSVTEVNGSAGSIVRFTQPYPEIYIRWYMRYQQNFNWSSLIAHKWLYFDNGQPEAVVPEFYSWNDINIWTPASGNHKNVNYGWDSVMANGALNGGGHRKSDGQWHCYEVHLKMDTNGSNGVGEIWIDGAKKLSYTNISYGTKPGWDWVIIGSNTQNPANGGDTPIDYDDIRIQTTGPIGCLTGSPTPTGNKTPSVPQPLTVK